MEDLCSLLLRFRTYETAIVANTEKAFLQINFQEQDRDVTRFLWLKDINKSVIPSNIYIFRFTRIPFGIISSQFILDAMIVYHLQSRKRPIAKQLMKDLYVDNLITGTSSKDAELQIYEQGKQLFKEMSMNLREWCSNSQTLRNSFKKEDRFDGKEMKVLGIIWNMNNNCIYTPVKESYEPETFTKTQILKRTASILDPLGFFNPSLLKAKLLLRDLWKMDIEWDKPIKDQFSDQWKEINEDLNIIKEKKLPRFIGNKEVELLCFCDASSKAYGTTIYLRCQEKSQTITNLIFSKSRVAPLKETSLPRLELLAVLIGTRSINFIMQSLQRKIHRKTLWTDSQYMLHWLKSKKILTPFFQRRIDEIQSNKGIEF